MLAPKQHITIDDIGRYPVHADIKPLRQDSVVRAAA